MPIRHPILAALLPAVALALAPVPALAKEVDAEAMDAARLEELAFLLNSVALRCRIIGIDMQAAFDAFADRQQAPLARAELALKRHFDVQGTVNLRGNFDRLKIRALNFYGTGRTDAQTCGEYAQVLDMLAKSDPEGRTFLQVAEIMVPRPLIEDMADRSASAVSSTR